MTLGIILGVFEEQYQLSNPLCNSQLGLASGIKIFFFFTIKPEKENRRFILKHDTEWVFVSGLFFSLVHLEYSCRSAHVNLSEVKSLLHSFTAWHRGNSSASKSILKNSYFIMLQNSCTAGLS